MDMGSTALYQPLYRGHGAWSIDLATRSSIPRFFLFYETGSDNSSNQIDQPQPENLAGRAFG